MAVDTREKRFSMMNVGTDDSISLFEADAGGVEPDDRQHLLGCYSGIAFAVAVSPFDGGVDAPTLVFGGGVDAPALVFGGGVAEPTIA